MSNRGAGDTVFPVTSSPAAPRPTTWWAGGLRLAERPPAPSGRTSARLAKWKAAHDTAEWFAARLADAGLDEDALAALLGEPPLELAARTGRPEWAAFVERATTDAPPAPHTGGTWQSGFAHVLRPARLDSAFTERLTSRLVRTAARTLVLELNLARQRGELVGATPADRFTCFVNGVDLSDLLARYPVLARMLSQTCLHAAEAHGEMLDRFAADRDRIVAELLDGVDPGAIIAVESGQGDCHGRGRTVCTLRFADGSRLVARSTCTSGSTRCWAGWTATPGWVCAGCGSCAATTTAGSSSSSTRSAPRSAGSAGSTTGSARSWPWSTPWTARTCTTRT